MMTTVMSPAEARAEGESRKAEGPNLCAVHHAGRRRFWRVAAAFFRQESEGRVYERRPNLSVNIPAEGDPPAKLAALPRWCRRGRQLDPERVELEFIVGRVMGRLGQRPTVEAHVEL